MLRNANTLRQITEETNLVLAKKNLERKNFEDMRNYAENILGDKLHGIAGVGKSKYTLESEKIPCDTNMLIAYLREHGYNVVFNAPKQTLEINW